MSLDERSFEAGIEAFRRATAPDADGRATRARVLAAAARSGRPRSWRRRAALALALGGAAVLSGSAAWTAAGRWRASRGSAAVASPAALEPPAPRAPRASDHAWAPDPAHAPLGSASARGNVVARVDPTGAARALATRVDPSAGRALATRVDPSAGRALATRVDPSADARAPAARVASDHAFAGRGERPALAAQVLPEATRRAGSAVTDGGTPSAGEARAYGRAHSAHFEADDPLRALALWDAYLREFPAGAFVPEARFNRALCLLRIGRSDAARDALNPFATGSYGGYRQREAQSLLDWTAPPRRSHEP